MAESIAAHVRRCLDLFLDLVGSVESPTTGRIDSSEPAFLHKARDEHTRFKIWAGNIGAHRTGMSSLDYRVRDASHIRMQIVKLLRDLAARIEDSGAIVRASGRRGTNSPTMK